MDTVRLVILGVFFVALIGAWIWSKRLAARKRAARTATAGFQVSQKRWLDQKTGVALIESEGQAFLLAYTVGGGVSWQPVAKQPAEVSEMAEEPAEDFERLLTEAEPVLMRFR
jgi:hypothetical protein